MRAGAGGALMPPSSTVPATRSISAVSRATTYSYLNEVNGTAE
jgi:hypothetical protein